MFVHATPSLTSAAGRRELTTFDGRPVDALYFLLAGCSTRSVTGCAEGLETLGPTVTGRPLRWALHHGRPLIEVKCRVRNSILYFDRGVKVAPLDVTPASHLALDIRTTGGVNGRDLGGGGDAELRGACSCGVERRRGPCGGGRGARQARLPDPALPEIVSIDPDVVMDGTSSSSTSPTRPSRAGMRSVHDRSRRGALESSPASGRVSIARVPGHVILDGIATLRSPYSFDRSATPAVSRSLLGRGKKIARGSTLS